MSITDSEFQYLKNLNKLFHEPDEIIIGPAPQKWTRKIESEDKTESFLLDYYRGSFEISKYTWNSRYKQVVVLIRYDSQGTHTNPDGVEISGPHFHIYQEGYGDKFAYEPSLYGIDPNADKSEICKKFLEYFHIMHIPTIQTTMY